MDHDPSGDGEADEPDPESYVGYGSPPKHTRWKQGFCPNPRGRPRNAKGRKPLLAKIAWEPCRVKIHGKVQTRTRLEVILFAVRNATANGNAKAQKIYDKLLNEVPQDEPCLPKGVLIVGEELTPEEWEGEYGNAGKAMPMQQPQPKLIGMADVAHLLPKRHLPN